MNSDWPEEGTTYDPYRRCDNVDPTSGLSLCPHRDLDRGVLVTDLLREEGPWPDPIIIRMGFRGP